MANIASRPARFSGLATASLAAVLALASSACTSQETRRPADVAPALTLATDPSALAELDLLPWIDRMCDECWQLGAGPSSSMLGERTDEGALEWYEWPTGWSECGERADQTRIGTWSTYDAKGSLRCELTYDDRGRPHGPVTYWDPERALRIDGELRTDKHGKTERFGLWTITQTATGARRVQWF